MSDFKSPWAYRDKVHLDGDSSIVGIVTGFTFRSTRDPVVEVSWVANGESKCAWFEEWRLSLANEGGEHGR